MLFDTFAIRLNKAVFADYDIEMNIIVSDIGENHTLRIKNGVVLVYENSLAEDAEVSITCPKNAFLLLINGNIDQFKGIAKVEGDVEIFNLFVENLNELSNGPETFNIVEP